MPDHNISDKGSSHNSSHNTSMDSVKMPRNPGTSQSSTGHRQTASRMEKSSIKVMASGKAGMPGGPKQTV